VSVTNPLASAVRDGLERFVDRLIRPVEFLRVELEVTFELELIHENPFGRRKLVLFVQSRVFLEDAAERVDVLFGQRQL